MFARHLWARLALLVATLCASPAFAITFYAAPNGNDANNGLTPTAPMTLARALTRVNPGDTIELLGGTYTGGHYINRPGTANAWITLKPYGSDKVIIDGAGRSVAMYFYRSDFAPLYWIMQGLEVRGGESYVVKIDSPQVRLIGNNLHGSRNDIVKLVSTADDVWIYKNEIHHNNAANGANAQGVDIVGADRTWIAYNYVHDIPSIALYAKGNSRNTIFENNRVENVYQRGIMLGQSTGVEFLRDGRYESYDGIIRNNVIINTRGPCLATASSWNVKIHNNSCYNAGGDFNAAIFVSNESELGQGGMHIEITNNIVVRSSAGSRPMLMLGPNAMADMATLHVDHNIYWVAGGAAPSFSWSRASGWWSGNFADWRALTGQDRASRVVDPRYAETARLTLSAASPAIDAVPATTCPAKDYADKARPVDGDGDGNAVCDCGAHEYLATAAPAPNVAPVVALTAPAGGARFTAPATIALAADASDSDGIARVEFYAGTTKLGEDTSAPYTYAWTGVPAGQYGISAKAFDTRGASTTSASTNIAVAAPNNGSGNGLKGEYFDAMNFTGPMLTRTDATVNFSWAGAPASGMGADTFSVRWTGQIEPRYSERYTFYTTSDDGVRLWVNGQLVIDNWTDHAARENSGSIALTAGQKVSVRMEYYENGYDAVARLAWSSASQAKEIVPQSQLYADTGAGTPLPDAPTPTPPPPPSGGTGTGLLGQYFDALGFANLTLTRLDANVNFSWAGAPASGMGGDTFSVRWSGQIEPRYSETYTFYTMSDDGVRLWVNGRLVIDNWTDHAARENSGGITLTAGQKVDIKMEFYENAYDAVARLSWSSASQAKEVVPSSRLYPAAVSAPQPAPTGLKGEYFNNMDLTALVLTRIDPAVDFNWGRNAPNSALGADTFSARWTGSLTPQFTEVYTFYTSSDDGVRLWVNGQLLVNNWWDQAATERSGRIALTAGVPVAIRMEYYDNGLDASARLSWSSASQAKQVIPGARLSPN